MKSSAVVSERLSNGSVMRKRIVVSAIVGNVLEMYDFLVFGIFAVPISKTFFPAGNDFAALILTFMTFAAGFLVRPLGAIVFGRYADRVGRKRALSLTLLMMAIGTLIPAISPSFAAIGIAAPIILVLGRLIQGFSAGGEIGSSVAMLVESASKANRCLHGAYQQMSQGGGVLVAGLIGLGLTSFLSEQQILAGYWRIAFLAGLIIGPIGWYIRQSIPETPEFVSSGVETRESLSTDFKTYAVRILMGIAVLVFWTVATYVSNYFSTFSVRDLHLPLKTSYIGQIAYSVTMILACPFVGKIADRIGLVKPMAFGAGLSALLAYPLFWLLVSYPSLPMLVLVQAIIALLLASYAACASLFLAELFPVRFRATGVGISYALGVTIFGGMTPLAVTGLIQMTGDKLSVGLYLAAAAAVSLTVVVFYRSARLQTINA